MSGPHKRGRTLVYQNFLLHMNTTSQRERDELRRRRIVWLSEHPEMWATFRPDQNARKTIVAAMKRDGLIALTTHWKDVRFESLFAEARKLRRKLARRKR